MQKHQTRAGIFLLCSALFFALLFAAGSKALALEVIIDNVSVNTERTGTWPLSGASNFYGADSVYSRDGSTFSWR
ncbi:MAG: hypothetical protein AB1805_17090, partial [Nitrospirota bacterium]